MLINDKRTKILLEMQHVLEYDKTQAFFFFFLLLCKSESSRLESDWLSYMKELVSPPSCLKSF